MMSKTFPNSDIPRFDLQYFNNSANIDDCESRCRNRSDCMWVNARGNECWLKTPFNNQNTTIGLKNDTPLYYKTRGDIVQNDVGSSKVTDIYACHERCKSDPRCKFYVFADDGTCYLKAPNASNDTTTRFILRGPDLMFDCNNEDEIRGTPSVCGPQICSKADGSGLDKGACRDWCRQNPTQCSAAINTWCTRTNSTSVDFCKPLICPKADGSNLDANCKSWCVANPGQCDTVATTYCKTSTGNTDFCGCYNFPRDPTASDKVKQTWIKPYCYVDMCSGSTSAYWPTTYNNDRGNCPSITICSNELGQTAGGSAKMSGIVTTINCGNQSSGSGSSGGSVSGHAATGGGAITLLSNTDSNQKLAIVGGVLGFFLLCCMSMLVAVVI